MARVVITIDGEVDSLESPDQDRAVCDAQVEQISEVLEANREEPGQVIELPWQHQLLAGVVTGVGIKPEEKTPVEAKARAKG